MPQIDFFESREDTHAKGKNDCPRTGSRGWLRWGVYSLALEIGGSLAVSGIMTMERLGNFWLQAESSSQMAKFIPRNSQRSYTFAHVTYLDVTLANLKTIQTSKLQIKTRELLCYFQKKQ